MSNKSSFGAFLLVFRSAFFILSFIACRRVLGDSSIVIIIFVFPLFVYMQFFLLLLVQAGRVKLHKPIRS